MCQLDSKTPEMAYAYHAHHGFVEDVSVAAELTLVVATACRRIEKTTASDWPAREANSEGPLPIRPGQSQPRILHRIQPGWPALNVRLRPFIRLLGKPPLFLELLIIVALVAPSTACTVLGKITDQAALLRCTFKIQTIPYTQQPMTPSWGCQCEPKHLECVPSHQRFAQDV